MTHVLCALPVLPVTAAPRWLLLGIAAVVLSACQPSARVATTPPPALTPVAVASTPPSAALCPDKQVARVRAGAVCGEAISAAYGNPSVNADAVNQQPWDASVKALTAFPSAQPVPAQARPAVTYRQSADGSNVVNDIHVASHHVVDNAPAPGAPVAPVPAPALPFAAPQATTVWQHHHAGVAGTALAGAVGAGALAAQHAPPQVPKRVPVPTVEHHATDRAAPPKAASHRATPAMSGAPSAPAAAPKAMATAPGVAAMPPPAAHARKGDR